MSNIKGFRGEGVRLDFNICSTDTVDKAWFSNVGVASNKDRSFVGVDSG